MKKLICWLSALAAISALVTFLFYFFKINPQYRPHKCCCDSDFEDEQA